ncbi:hypothetical protein NI447_01880 [Enterococcus lactis]|nr:hypothetical protein [Enterococcus lactis]
MGRLPERDTKISARSLGIAMTQDKVTKCKKAKQAAEVEASTAKKRYPLQRLDWKKQ